MDIYKAFEKQKKSYRRFIILMTVLFFTLPLIAYLTGKTQAFFIGYLIFIEILILAAVIIAKDKGSLTFDVNNNKIMLKIGLLKRKYNILCHKVVCVHSEKEYEDLQIIVLTNQKFRNKFFKPITENFLKKYPLAAHEYIRIKRIAPEYDYYYFVVKKGGFLKYELLELLYKNCVNAVFTESSISNLKKIRWENKYY